MSTLILPRTDCSIVQVAQPLDGAKDQTDGAVKGETRNVDLSDGSCPSNSSLGCVAVPANEGLR